MTDGDKKSPQGARISEQDRFRYIGFEVFPGKPKDLFKSAAEKEKIEATLAAKRAKGEVIREDCKLLEKRVSMAERLVLAAASVIMLVALVLPWYAAYTEIQEQPKAVQQTAVVPSDGTTAPAESGVMSTPAPTTPQGPAVTSHSTDRSNEQIITGHTTKRKVVREYSQLSGLGAFAELGTVFGDAFSSGFALWFSVLLMLVYTLLAIGLPVLNLYGLFGLKGTPDQQALVLKGYLRLNWLPVMLFGLMVLVSFIGADYGFAASEVFTSFGSSYGPGVLLGSLSWGVFVTIAASVLIAAKGIEI